MLGTRLAITAIFVVATMACTTRELSLDEIRSSSDRFRDVNVALAEGYVADTECTTAAMMGRSHAIGAMGVHFAREDLLGISGPPNPRVDGTGTHTDFSRPAVLLYEPQSDGSLVLVGVENLVFADAWRAAGHDQPPSFHGVPYDLMSDDPLTSADEAHLFAPHYDRHIWLYRDNPSGIFASFNPKVSCAHFKGSFQEHANHR